MFKYVASIINLFKHNTERMPYKLAVGAQGEQIAAKFLKKNGYKILQRNYRCKYGELDIVCYDHGVIVFIEVKTRYSNKYGTPELSVTEAKKANYKGCFTLYRRKKIEGIDLRFDVVSIFNSPIEKHPTITLFKNAFTKVVHIFLDLKLKI